MITHVTIGVLNLSLTKKSYSCWAQILYETCIYPDFSFMHSKHTLLGIVASAVKCRSAVDASRILWQREIHIHDMVMPSDSFRQSLILTSHKIFTRKKCCFVAVLRLACLHCYRLSGTEAASCFLLSLPAARHCSH